MDWTGRNLDRVALAQAAQDYVCKMHEGAPKEMGVVLLLVNQATGQFVTVSAMEQPAVRHILRDAVAQMDNRVVIPTLARLPG